MTSVRVEGVCFDLLLHQNGQLSNENWQKGELFFILELNGSICRFLYIKKLSNFFYVVTSIWPNLFSSIAF